jgi:MSHA biogenesis protein MshJ
MLRFWNKVSGRYDALNKRERLIVLAAAMLLAYALMDAMFLAPLLTRQRQAAQELAQRQILLRQLREQVEQLARARAVDPDAANRTRLDQTRQRLKELGEDIETQSAQLIPPERMRGVLEKFLASRPRLQLAELKTLPRTTVVLPGEARPGAAGRDKTAGRDPDAGAVLYKHGIEMTLKGRYLDLLEYLRDVEGLPDRLYWDKVELLVQEYPVVVLKITLYTVSMDRAWLLV